MVSNPPRVFLDTSVLIAAILSARGSARDLINHGFRGGYELLISPDVVEECERNLGAKAPTALPLLTAFLALLTHRVQPSGEDVQQAAAIVEAKDAPIVAAAHVAGAAFLASYDRKHLLAKAEAIAERYGIVVTTPDAVLRRC